jgi:hypothetical protein
MPWTQSDEFDVYDDEGQRFTLRLCTLTDEKGALVKKVDRTSSGLVAKQISATESRYPGANKFILRTTRPSPWSDPRSTPCND